MSTLPEQFSAARKSQIEAQLQLFSKLSARAVSGTEQLVALNLNTTRAAVDHSSAMVRQMLAAQDPRELLALAGETQHQFDSMLAYGRALAGIATGLQADLGQAVLPVTTRKAQLLPTPDNADALEESEELAMLLEPAFELAPAEEQPPTAKPVAKAARPAPAPFPTAEGKD